MRRHLLAALLWLSSPVRAGDWSWHETMGPHFIISHEAAFMPGGFTIGLERLHGRLRLDLAMFSPWMSKERLKLFLYKGKETYLAGEFQPPPWSNGLALYSKRTVVVYDQGKEKTLQVLAHETTHLLFESYWGEMGREPPTWLNEGLAMVEEADPAHPERSDWFAAMANMEKVMRMDDFLRTAPASDLKEDKDRAAVGIWYAQAYSLVYFLFRTHTKLQFKSFCGKLRDGDALKDALWSTYRYRSVSEFEAAWLDWLRDPAHKKRLEAQPAGSASLDLGEREPIGTIKGFKPLRP